MRTTNDPLRLPASIMQEAKKAAEQDGVSLNEVIGTQTPVFPTSSRLFVD